MIERKDIVHFNPVFPECPHLNLIAGAEEDVSNRILNVVRLTLQKERKSAGQIRILYRLKNMEYSTPPFDSRRFLDLEMNKEYSWDNLFGAKSEKGDLIEVAISNLVHVKQNLESSKIPKDHGIIEILSDIVTFLKTNVSCKNQ